MHARRQKDSWFGVFQSAKMQGPRAEAGPTTIATKGGPIAEILMFHGVVLKPVVLTSWALNRSSSLNRFDSKPLELRHSQRVDEKLIGSFAKRRATS